MPELPKNFWLWEVGGRGGTWLGINRSRTVMQSRTLRQRKPRKQGPPGEFPMDTTPATEAGSEGDGEESSEACTAKTAAQSGNDTEPVSAMEAGAPDEDGASASAAAPASPVENTDGGNAPETDARGEADSKKSDDSESPKKSTPMTTPLPDFDSLNGNKLSVWEEHGLWPCKMLVLDLTDLQQHVVYRRMVEIHMQGEGLKLEYIDSVNICLNFISQILDNLEVEGHARGCGYCCKADKEVNLALYHELEGCDYQVYLPDNQPHCVRYPKTLHPLATVLLDYSSDPMKYKPRTMDRKVKYAKIALPTIWKILVSLHVFPATPLV